MTQETFDAGWALLMKQWPKSEVMPDVYWTVLHDMDDELFQRAVLACLESCKFFPVIAEIREKALEVLGAAGLLPKTGEQAWAALVALLPKYSTENGWHGCGAPSPLDDLTEQAVRTLGGMRRLCNCALQDLGFLRKEFLEYYEPRRQREMAYGPNLLAQPVERRALVGASTCNGGSRNGQ